MKKIVMFLMFGMLLCGEAKSETIVVIDGNGVVTKQIITAPTEYTQSAVVTLTPRVTVVQESPYQNNGYYYDKSATGAALAAGVTTAIVGGLLYHGFRHGKHHKPHGGRPPKPHHGGKKHRR